MDNEHSILSYKSDPISNQSKSSQNTQMSKEEYSKFRQDLISTLNANLLKRFSIIDQVS